MTPQDTIEAGNRLIAEFMGAKYHKLEDDFNITEVMWYLPGNNPNPHCNAGSYKRITELEYNIRWDWLIPVVEKIILIREVVSYSFRFGQVKFQLDGFEIKSPCSPHNNSITECWQACVQFIVWYNQNILNTKK